MRRWIWILFFIVFSFSILGGCSEKSTLVGRLEDPEGRKLAGVEVTIEQAQPLSGYDRFVVVTDQLGIFTFDHLYPSSDYVLKSTSDTWIVDRPVPVRSAPNRETLNFPYPLVFRKSVYLDPATGLQWQVYPNRSDIKFAAAKKYCEKLSFKGYSDWRLPTISELRSLIRNCRRTRLGGACNVTDQCLDESCENYRACQGCISGKGPGKDGAYWPKELVGDTSWYWSSSRVGKNRKEVWVVFFKRAFVLDDLSWKERKVRCVRKTQKHKANVM